MSGLVLELQRDALNGSVSTLDILRKALVVARKLSLKDFEQWIKLELDGYQSNDIPDYRKTQGQLRAWNPFHGWQPVVAVDELSLEVLEEFSNVRNSQPIGELIELVKNPESNLSLVLSSQAETYLSQFIDAKVRISVSSSSISKILQAVKNIILEWSLRLEGDGIIGEGMSFSDQEKQIAQKHTSEYINCIFMNSSHQPNQVNNFNAPVGAFQNGDYNTSNVNQTIGSNNQEILQGIAELRQQINTLAEENQDVATDALDTLESAVNSPTKQTKVKSALFSLWGVAQGIASFANAVTAIADRFGVKFHQ